MVKEQNPSVGLVKKRSLGGIQCLIQAYSDFPHYIVAATSRERIILFDMKSFRVPQERRIVQVHGECVNYVMKWDSKTFVSCSDDRKIVAFRIEGKNGSEYFYRMNKFPVLRLLKLDDANFLRQCINKKYSLSNIDLVNGKRDINLVASKSQKNCFFVNSGDCVLRINWKTDQRIRYDISGVSNFFSYQRLFGEEILCLYSPYGANSSNGTISLFDCQKKKIIKTSSDFEVFGLTCFSPVRNKFICCGNTQGVVKFLKLEEDGKDFTPVLPTAINPDFPGQVNSISVLSTNPLSTVICCTGTFGRSVDPMGNSRVTCIASLNFRYLWDPQEMEKLAMIDQNERLEFVHEKVEDYFGGNYAENRIGVRLRNMSLGVMKMLFY